MNLRDLKTQFFNDTGLSLLQTNINTWINGFLSNFQRLLPNGIVVTDSQNNLFTYSSQFNYYKTVVTLVGGAGNTTPQYLTTNTRFLQIGSICFVDILLSGDGGAEGAGTGQFNLTLPFKADVNQPSGLIPIGQAINNATRYSLYGEIDSLGTTIKLSYQDAFTTVATFNG